MDRYTKFLFLGILVSATCATAADWNVYEDPSGVVSARIPSSWQPEDPTDMGFSRIISFKLPEESAEFTISITPNLRLPPELPVEMLQRFFPAGASLTEPKRMKGNGWNGVRLDAKAEIGGRSRTWLGAFYGAGSTMVAITLSDDTEEVKTRGATFSQVVESVRVQPAQSPVRNRDQPTTLLHRSSRSGQFGPRG